MKRFTGVITKRVKISIAILSAILLMILLCSCGQIAGHKEEVRKHIMSSLKAKYGIEFEVKPYLMGGDWTGNDVWEADAHPKEQPNIEFKVKGQQYTKHIKIINGEYSDDSYSDNYPDAKWTYQGRQVLEKRLREIYGEDVNLNISSYKFECSPKFANLDYEQVIENRQGNPTVHVAYDVFMDSTQFNKTAEAKKAFKLLKFLILDAGATSYSFSVMYVDKALQKNYLNNPKPYTVNWRVLNLETRFSDDYEKRVESKKILGELCAEKSYSKQDLLNNEIDMLNYIKVGRNYEE